jgi:hypothetical protein
MAFNYDRELTVDERCLKAIQDYNWKLDLFH